VKTQREWSRTAGPPIAIVPFRDEFAPSFEALNRAWLESFELLEEGDLPYLQDPRGRILEKGGAVFCAVAADEVVGTVALLRLSSETFELAKLTVAPSARGQGLGRRLTQEAIDFAVSAGARRLTLSSSSKLREAIRLYESMGFVHSPPSEGGVSYASADVFMRLQLR
jgi:putative acetyltransferase